MIGFILAIAIQWVVSSFLWRRISLSSPIAGNRGSHYLPRSPWQNAFADRLIGSIRRECLDHVVVPSRRHLRHLLKNYLTYYHRSRTHLALTKDAPAPRHHASSRDYGDSASGRVTPPLGTASRVRAEDNMSTLNRSAIVVTPKQPFLDWLHAADPTSLGLTLLTLRGSRRSTSSQNGTLIKT